MPITWNAPTVREAMQMGPDAFVPPPETIEDSDTAFWDRGLINLRLENSVASAIHKNVYYGSDEEDVAGFNPFVDLEDRYWNFTDEIVEARSPDQLAQTKAFIDRHVMDREIQAEGGVSTFMWSMGAGLLDPITWPLMAVPILRAGQGAAKVAGQTAALGVLDAGLQETALHSTQPGRTWEESLMAMGATGVLGGGIGAWAGAASRSKLKAVENLRQQEADVIDMLENGGLKDVPDTSVSSDIDARSVGAAQTRDEYLDLPTLEGEGAGVSKKWAPWAPGIRLLNSTTAGARAFANKIWGHDFRIGKNEAGVKSETGLDKRIVGTQNKMAFKATSKGKEYYSKMAGAGFTSARFNSRFRDGGMTYPQFMEETGKAISSGHVHDIPEVQEYAKFLKSEIFDPIAAAYQKLGDLPQYLKVDFAEGYLPRVYDKQYIKDHRLEWEGMLDEHFQGKGWDINKRTNAIKQVTNSILDAPRGRIYGDIASTTNGRLKDRTLDIRDEILQQNKFLITNVNDVMERYLRSTVPELILKQGSDYRGTRGLQADVKVKARAEAKAAGAKARDKIAKQRDEAIEELERIKPSVLRQTMIMRITARTAKLIDDYKIAEGGELVSRTAGKSDKQSAHMQRLSEKRVAKFANKMNKERDTEIAGAKDKKVSELIETESAALAKSYRVLSREGQAAVKEDVFARMKEDIEVLEYQDEGQLIFRTEIEEIKDQHEALIAASKDNKERVKREKNRDDDIRDVEAMRDILLGKYAPPDNALKAVTNASQTMRGLMFMVHLGGMMISAIPDMARPMMQHGLRAYVKALPAAFPYFVKGLKAQKIAMQEIGIGVDGMANSRIYATGGVEDLHGRMGKAAKMFGHWSGMNHWNSFWKQQSAFVAQHRLISDSLNYKSLSKNRKTRLAKAGIDEDIANRIAAQRDNFEQLPGGGWVANTKTWQTDLEVADHFDNVLIRDVENTIDTPSVGDKPLLMERETAKVMLQFKSFFMAAHSQTFLPMMQQMSKGDMTALSGMATSFPLAMMTYIIKMQLAGQSEKLEGMSPQDRSFQAADRSGLAPMVLEGWNLANKLSNGRIGQSIGVSESSRYFYRNKMGSLLGPGVGYLNDAGDVMGAMLDDKNFTASDLHKARRLIPYQNLFYFRYLINALEKQVAEKANFKDGRRK